MKDSPWSTSGDVTDFERELLSAAKNDHIPAPLKRRMSQTLQAQLAAAATLGTAQAAAAQTTTTASTPALGAGGGLLFSKTTAIGLASAVLVGGAIGWHQLRREPPAPPQPSAAVAGPTAAEPSSPPPQLSAADPPPPAPADSATSLHEEIVLIDSARKALKAAQPARALQHLETYDARFPTGALVPEAAALRIEALVRSGAVGRAKQLAERFLATYPSSPLAQRVERLAPGGR